jgi:4-amino-4-deoxy-L-arabinose transferase-like glycosyltransferase
MFLLLMPWTLCLAAAFGRLRAWEWGGHDTQSRLRVFAFAWLVAPVLFFSVSGSKLPGYVLPALPGAILLIADWLTRHLQDASPEVKSRFFKPQLVLRATGGGMIPAACGGAAFAVYTGEASAVVSALIAVPVVVAGLFIYRRADEIGKSITAITAVTLLAVLLAAVFAVGRAGENHSSRELLRRAAVGGFMTEPLYGLYMFDRTAEFYAPAQVAYTTEGEPVIFDSRLDIIDLVRQLDAERGNRPAVLVFTFPYAVPHLTGNAELDAEVVGSSSHVALVRVRRR